jgi:hypothetical protein
LVRNLDVDAIVQLFDRVDNPFCIGITQAAMPVAPPVTWCWAANAETNQRQTGQED